LANVEEVGLGEEVASDEEENRAEKVKVDPSVTGAPTVDDVVRLASGAERVNNELGVAASDPDGFVLDVDVTCELFEALDSDDVVGDDREVPLGPCVALRTPDEVDVVVAAGESETLALCDAIADGEEHTVAEGLERCEDEGETVTDDDFVAPTEEEGVVVSEFDEVIEAEIVGDVDELEDFEPLGVPACECDSNEVALKLTAPLSDIDVVADSVDDTDVSTEADELSDGPSEGVSMIKVDTEGNVEPVGDDEASTEPEIWPLTERSEEREGTEEAVVV
jgi:hypothetical protein